MITICLGFRAWHHEHLRHCLASLERLELPVIVTDLTMLIDQRCADICTLHGARYVHASSPMWSRSLALNAASTYVQTSHVCFTDADMIFPRTWRPRAEKALREDVRMLWLTPSRDLDSLATTAVQQHDPLHDDTLRLLSTAHPDTGQGAGMLMDIEWFRRVGGFDLAYSVWGAEDNDLVLRAQWNDKSVSWMIGNYVAHQYHRRDWPTPEQFEQVKKNRAYLAERIAEKGPVIRNWRTA